jgi:hypothetical protein
MGFSGYQMDQHLSYTRAQNAHQIVHKIYILRLNYTNIYTFSIKYTFTSNIYQNAHQNVRQIYINIHPSSMTTKMYIKYH